MRVLIAEDDRVSRRILETRLAEWGFEVESTGSGDAAWEVLQGLDAPSLAVLDWQMPGMDGVEICRRLRERAERPPVYLILLTTLGRTEDLVAGLEAGADDYVRKPFEPAELRARLQVGIRMLGLQQALADRVAQLEEALGNVNQLQGLLPICMYCKKVRDDRDYWHQVESYVARHTGTTFSHGVCPSCYETILKPQIEGQKRKRR